MKLLSVFRKGLREQRRDLLGLGLTLSFAPFFVFLYWLFFPAGSTTYGVLVLNNDAGVTVRDGTRVVAGRALIQTLRGVTYPDGKSLLKVGLASNRADAETRLRNRDAAALVIIPPRFSRALKAARLHKGMPRVSVTLVGDLTYPSYALAAVMAKGAVDGYVQAATGRPPPVQVSERPLGGSAVRTEFENYVPGLLVFAAVMLVILASMTVTREVEAGTLKRLVITRMTSWDFLGGISAVLVLVGTMAVILTFLTAVALGFRSQGPLWVAVLVGALTSLSVVGAGLIVTCFARTVIQAFLLATFPQVLFMFFTGAIFPVPRVAIATVAGHTIGLYDILPPTHAVVALNKVLTLGSGIGGVLYELAALLVLTVVYFGAGVWLFRRTRLARG